jgi:hypothetical protein
VRPRRELLAHLRQALLAEGCGKARIVEGNQTIDSSLVRYSYF